MARCDFVEDAVQSSRVLGPQRSAGDTNRGDDCERDGHSASGEFAISKRTCSFGTKIFSTIHMSNLPCFRTSLDASRTYADPSIERLKSNASVPFNARAISGRFV